MACLYFVMNPAGAAAVQMQEELGESWECGGWENIGILLLGESSWEKIDTRERRVK